MNVTIGQPISHRIDHMLSGTRANIAVKILAMIWRTLRALAKRGRQGDARPYRARWTSPRSSRWRFHRPGDVRSARRLPGMAWAPAPPRAALQTAFVGQQVGEILEGQVSFPLVVRYDAGEFETWRRSVRRRSTRRREPESPLAAVADIREDRGPNFISRENVQRKIVVQCNVAGRDLRGLVNDIERRCRPRCPCRAGTTSNTAGSSKARHARPAAAVAGLGRDRRHLRYPDHRVSFIRDETLDHHAQSAAGADRRSDRSLRPGGVLSVASIIGFITLFGVATRNGIMLVSHVKHLMREGVEDLREAVRRGATERLAPIFMTAMAAGLALVPDGARPRQTRKRDQAPMAIVILFGLLSSTALNMIVLPALYVHSAGPCGRQRITQIRQF